MAASRTSVTGASSRRPPGRGASPRVKNERDGSVSNFVQGDKRALDEFARKVAHPPGPAEVRDAVRSPAKARPRLKYFEVASRGLLEEVQEGFGAMQAEFSDYRNEFKDYRNEFKDYRNEFKGFAERTDQNFGSLGGKLDGFASRTDENFKLLGDKYAEISTKLSDILETLQKESAETRADLKRSVDNLSRLVDEYIAQEKQKPS
jgi:acylphosphatase